MFKSLLPFVLAALVLESAARPVHPPSDVPTGMIPRSSNNISTPLDAAKGHAPLPIAPRKATSHGAAPAPQAPLALVPRQDEEEDQAESTARRHSHRKPRPSKDSKPLEGSIHLGPRVESNNTTLPAHVPRSQNSTMPIKLPRSTNSTTTPTTLPLHVPRDHNSTLPVVNSRAEHNSTMPIHVPRSSTHSPAEAILHDAPHHPRPRTTVEMHVPAEKLAHVVPGHHRRDKQEHVDDDEEHDEAPATPILVPRHSTGVEAADKIIHSSAHMLRQELDEARYEFNGVS